MNKEDLFALQPAPFPESVYAAVKDNWNHVAKPLDGLGVLEEMLCTIGAVQETTHPQLDPRALVILCADNGVVQEGVSQSGQDVTLAVARNMGNLRSSVCKMAEIAKARVITVDIGINSGEEIPGVRNRKVRRGTRDFLQEPAMTEEELLQAVRTGIELAGELRKTGIRLIATGEMGIGNTTTSTAIAAGILRLNVDEITGKGAGLSSAGIRRKKQVIREGLKKYGFLKEGEAADPPAILSGRKSKSAGDFPEDVLNEKERTFRILRCVGGLDIAGLCGVFIGGAIFRVPVIIDGLISAAAALCAEHLVPGTRNFMLASHAGAEPGMRDILSHLGLSEIIHARLALGEGTGAVLLCPLLDMANAVYRESGSCAEIGVEQYERNQS